MPAPVYGRVAAELADALAPHATADAANGYVFAHVVQAVGLMLQPVDDLIRDTDQGPGWSSLVDVTRAPDAFLPYLAQLYGVRLTVGLDPAAQRLQIATVDGQRRGRPATLITKAQATLTGDRMVRLVERTTSAYALTVITRTSETPDPAATNTALQAAKPAGLVLTHVVSSAPLVDEGTRSIDAAANTIDAATLADIT